MLLWLAALLPCAMGCDEPSKEPLRVLAAQSLIDPYTAMETAFEKAHPGLDMDLTTASSGQLRAQIEAGAPADVFASASQHHMHLLAEQGRLVAGTRRDFARNQLVLIVPKGSAITAPEALAGASVKHIAVGDWGHVPAGRYTREVLVHRGLLETLQPKIRQCQHVRQVLTYVATGEVEAGFVYRTDADKEKAKVQVAWTAETGDHAAIKYPIAALAGSRRHKDARRFIDFVASAAGQRILREHSFLVTPLEAAPAGDAAKPER